MPHLESPFLDFVAGDVDTVQLRASKPLLVVAWRTGCSTCRLSMPFFDRIARRYPGATVVGLCQDDDETSRAYVREHGFEFTLAIDEGLAATRRFELRTVPTYWLVGAGGDVLIAGESWDAGKVEAIGARLAEMLGQTPEPIVTPDDGVPAFKPG
ncbi:MAG TPA: TlpA disulfide reductase family protein [Fimbriimonadaceae bacterium]|nr:TlpA disulfide reductase family protein [Fimbriimonadaceae bacterium]